MRSISKSAFCVVEGLIAFLIVLTPVNALLQTEYSCKINGYNWLPNSNYPGTYSFTNNAVDTLPSGFTVSDAGLTAQVKNIINDHNKVLYTTATSGTPYITNLFSAPQSKGTIEFWVNLGQKDKFIAIDLWSGAPTADAQNVVLIAFNQVGLLQCINGAGFSYPSNYSANTWYHMKITFDCATDKYNLYIDDIPVLVNIPFYGNKDMSTIDRFTIWHQDTGGNIYLDGLSYSWDSNYHIGDNANAGCCGDDVINLRKGLISEWHLDEGTGSIVNDDISSNYGSISGATWTSGKYGSALDFNGGQLVSVPAYYNLVPTTALTVTAWVNPDDISAEQCYVMRQEDWGFSIAGSFFRCQVQSSVSNWVINSGGNPTIGRWDFITCVYDGSNLKMYINGSFVSSSPQTGTILNDGEPGQGFYIGSCEGWSPRRANAKIDEVRVYNRALSDREIRYLYEMSPYAYINYTDTFTNGTLGVDSSYCVGGDLINELDNSPLYCSLNGNTYLTKDWALESFKYQKNITITSSVALTDYQIPVNPMTYNTTGLVASYHFSEDGSSIRDYSGNNNYGSLYGSTIGLLHFDEGIGTNVYDSSMSSRTGTLTGATWTNGIYGNAIKFDGVDDYITLAGSDFTYQTFSISTWVKTGAVQPKAYADIIDNNHGSNINWVIQQEGSLTNRYIWGPSNNCGVYCPAFTLTADKWQHLVITIDKLTRVNNIYLDGVLVNSSIGTADIAYTNPSTIRLGEHAGGTLDRNWNGTLDELAFYNKSLSTDEIKSLYYSQRAKFIEYSEGYESKGIGLRFDGVDDYVNVGSLGISGVNTRSIWFKPTKLSGNQYMLDMGGNNYWIQLYDVDTDGKLELRAGAGSTTYVDSNYEFIESKWYNVVVTMSSSNILSIYVNGVLDNSASKTSGTPGTLNIGRYGGGSNYFEGYLDEVLIYNRALSANEISDLYNERKGRLDYADLRFYNATGSELNYYTEYDNTTWVNVPSIPSGNSNITMYYGNPGATSKRNGETTFDFFDDFNNGYLDSAKWVNTGISILSYGPGYLSIKNSGYGYGDPAIYTLKGFNNYAFDTRVLVNTNNALGDIDYWLVDGTHYYAMQHDTRDSMDNDFCYKNGASTGCFADYRIDWVTNQWVNYYGNLYGATFNFIRGTQTGSVTNPQSFSTTNRKIGLSADALTGNFNVDYLKVRKYNSPEPTVTTQGEEYILGNSTGLIAHYTFDNDLDNKTIDFIGRNTGSLYGSTVGLWHFDDPYYSSLDSTSYTNNGGLRGDTLLLMHFDDGSGLTTKDETGYAYTAATTGTISWSSNSISNKALNFGGGIVSTNFPATTMNTWTMSAWVYDTKGGSVSPYYRSIIQINTNADDAFYLLPTTNGGGLGFWPCITSSTVPVSMNTWTHVAATYDNSIGFKFYINGVLVGTSGVCADATDWQFIRIGGSSTTDTEYFGGNIDEVAVYKKVLSQSEIADLYTSQKAKFIEYNTTAKSGTALKFDGVDDYIYTSNSIGLTGSMPRTLSLWMKTNALTRQAMAGWGAGVANQAFILEHSVTEAACPIGKLYFVGFANDLCTDFTVNNNEWHHVLATYNSTHLLLYGDGTLIGIQAKTLSTTNSVLNIGRQMYPDSTNYRYFDGLIDELAIYNKSLTPDEVTYLYNSQKAEFMEHVEGTSGKGLEFNGLSDYIKIPDNNFNFPAQQGLTITGWIKSYSSQSNKGLIGDYVSNTGTMLWIYPANKLNYDFNNQYSATGGATLPINEWAHIALTWDKTNFATYLNGVLDLSGTVSAFTDGGDFQIGTYALGTNFNGTMDDFRIYNRALSLNEINEIYSNTANNYGCCGDDYWMDTFYNGTLSTTNNFCIDGVFINQEIDNSNSLCDYYGFNWFEGLISGDYPYCCGDDYELDNFETSTYSCIAGFQESNYDSDENTCINSGYKWLTGTITGDNGACCGDDGINDNFYNGSIEDTTNFCVAGDYINQAIDDFKNICDYYDYNWFSNSVAIYNRITYYTGNYVYGFSVGDVNNDGYPDILASRSSSALISVYINNGDGTLAAEATYPTVSNPFFSTLGDLNNDGYLDFISVSLDSGQMGVLINDGDGTFASSVTYPIGGSAYHVTVGDFNGDNYFDAVIAVYGSNQLSVFMNDGDGTFAAFIPYTTGTNPNDVVVGDLDSDGDIDIVSVDEASNQLSVFMNDGDGTFATLIPYTTGTAPRAVVVGDLDSDSDLDVVVGDYGPSPFGSVGDISVFMNDGDGNFASRVSISEVSRYSHLDIKDIDGDGDLDVIGSDYNYQQVDLYKNNGDGTFASRIPYSVGISPTESLIIDFDNDGDQDIISCDYNSRQFSFINISGINGINGPCCGDDDTLDNFNNASLYCVNGEPYSDADLVEGLCTLSYDWLPDSISGDYPSCCGDDLTDDNFYSSITDCIQGQICLSESVYGMDLILGSYDDSCGCASSGELCELYSNYDGLSDGICASDSCATSGIISYDYANYYEGCYPSNECDFDLDPAMGYSFDGYCQDASCCLEQFYPKYLGESCGLDTDCEIQYTSGGTYYFNADCTGTCTCVYETCDDANSNQICDYDEHDLNINTCELSGYHWITEPTTGDYPNCCGNDLEFDLFYNGSISTTSHFCQLGSYTNQPIDSNQTICEYYSYEWILDSMSGEYPSCCGDDESSDIFYNGSIATTNNFCHLGSHIQQPIDANQTICAYYGYDWLSNTSYPATISFDSDAISSEPTEAIRSGTDGVYEIVAEIDNHYKVLGLTLVGIGNQHGYRIDFKETSQSGEIELWFHKSGTRRNELAITSLGSVIGWIFLNADNTLTSWDGTTTYPGGTYTKSIWNKLKISFNPSTDTMSVYLNDELRIDNVPTYSLFSTINGLRVTYQYDTLDPLYIDSIDLSWDSNINKNYTKCCGDDIIDLQNGLVGEWHMDETTGTIAYDTTGSNNGALNNMETTDWVSGKYGNALDFDGSNDYVNLGNSQIFNITAQITISAWVKVSADTDYGFIVGKRDSTGTTMPYELLYHKDINKFHFQSRKDGIWYTATDNEIVTLGQWYHIVGVFDGSNMIIYRNAVKTIGSSSSSISFNSANVSIGRTGEYTVSDSYFSGLIDEVRIYNRALSDNEIKALYTNLPYSYEFKEDYTNNTLNCCCNGHLIPIQYSCDRDSDKIEDAVCGAGHYCNSSIAPVITFNTKTINIGSPVTININSACQPDVRIIKPDLREDKLLTTSCGENCYTTTYTPTSDGYHHIQSFNGKYSYNMLLATNPLLIWNNKWSNQEDEQFAVARQIRFNNTLTSDRINQLVTLPLTFNQTQVYCNDIDNDGYLNDTSDYLGLRLTRLINNLYYETPFSLFGVNCTDYNLTSADISFTLNIESNSIADYFIHYTSNDYHAREYIGVEYNEIPNRYANNSVLMMEYDKLDTNLTMTLFNKLGTNEPLQAYGDYIIKPIELSTISYGIRNLITNGATPYEVKPGYILRYSTAPNAIFDQYPTTHASIAINQTYAPYSYYTEFSTNFAYLNSNDEYWYKHFSLNLNKTSFNTLADNRTIYNLNKDKSFDYSTSWITLFNQETSEGVALIRINTTGLTSNPLINYTNTNMDSILSVYPIATTTYVSGGEPFGSEYAVMTYNSTDHWKEKVNRVSDWLTNPINYTILDETISFDILSYDYDSYIDRSDEMIAINISAFSNAQDINKLHTDIYDSTGNITLSEDYDCTLQGNYVYDCSFAINPQTFACKEYNASIYAIGVDGLTNTKHYNFTFDVNDIIGTYSIPKDTLISTNQLLNVVYTYCDGSDPSNINLNVKQNEQTIHNEHLPLNGEYKISYTNPLNPTITNFKLNASDNQYWDYNSFNSNVVKSNFTLGISRKVYSQGTPGYRSNVITITNPSSNSVIYQIALRSDKLLVRFSENKNTIITVNVPAYSKEVVFIDVFPVTIGTYQISFTASNKDIELDSSLMRFEAIVQTTYSSGVFNYTIVSGIDNYAIMILLLLVMGIIFIKQKL